MRTGAKIVRHPRRQPSALWIFKALDGFGLALIAACILAVMGSIALEVYDNFRPK